MQADVLAENDTYVQLLHEAVQEGLVGFQEAPKILRAVLEKDRWRERRVRTGEVVRFERWEDFVTTPPIKGLGTSVEMIDKFAKIDGTLDRMVAHAKTQKVGGNRNPQGISGAKPSVIDDIVINDGRKHGRTSPDGNSSQQARKRLSIQSPDLYARVEAGELSPHAAMVEAGFRRRTITIPIEAERAARAIRRHFSDESIRELVAILSTPN